MIKAHLFGGQEHSKTVEVCGPISELRFIKFIEIDYLDRAMPTDAQLITYKIHKKLSDNDFSYIIENYIKLEYGE